MRLFFFCFILAETRRDAADFVKRAETGFTPFGARLSRRAKTASGRRERDVSSLDARLRATIAGFPFLERSLERSIYVAYVVSTYLKCLKVDISNAQTADGAEND